MNQNSSIAIRQAISREDYPRALKLWSVYASELAEEVQRGELTDIEMRQAGELFEWCGAVMRGARSHLQAQLNRAHGAAAYLPRSCPAVIIRTRL